MCGHELTGEEWIAAAPRDDLVDQRARRRCTEQHRDTLGDVVALQPFEVQATCRRQPGEFGQPASLRRTGGDLVGAEGADEDDPLVDEVAGQKVEQVPRHRVGPVQILEPHHDGRISREVAEQLEDGNEQPSVRRSVGR